ncbi:site-specific DNA-methyltransferase (plasmid) [Acinetobacter variabilis]|nr:site-specific DNA-methyltransferase [Acinetobacter variabilis]
MGIESHIILHSQNFSIGSNHGYSSNSNAKKILKQFPKFWNGENLQRSLVIDAIQKKEADLVKALINNSKIKSIYSTDVDGVLIFEFEKLISLLKYKEYWADSFTKYRNNVGLTSEGKYLDYSSDVVLDFPFKDCVLEGGMTKEDQGKDEIYYNEIIARDEIDRLFSPKVFTNSKRYIENGVQEDIGEFTNQDNLIIKGNNLIALHSLKLNFSNSIKCIFIDPPYYFIEKKPADTFVYNSNFKLSSWLVFMKNRLEIARELLTEDGVLYLNIVS